MKNIHILPTDKPSRLKQNNITKKISLAIGIDLTSYTPVNIYITSDEEIKEGDWILDLEDLTIGKVKDAKDKHNIEIVYNNNQGSGLSCNVKNCSEAIKYPIIKIILTTDQDLIKDGVQAIDDEFLEWFVKNTSCEFVEIKPKLSYIDGKYIDSLKIIIPKEEAINHPNILSRSLNTKVVKQETLEEAFTVLKKEFPILNKYEIHHLLQVARFGAKWQQEKMYSEEDMKKAFKDGKEDIDYSEVCGFVSKLTTEEWFEQFKNK